MGDLGLTTGILHLSTSGALFNCNGVRTGRTTRFIHGLCTLSFSTAMQNAVHNIISKLLQLCSLVSYKSMEISAQFFNMYLHFSNIRLECMNFWFVFFETCIRASCATRSAFFLLAVIALGSDRIGHFRRRAHFNMSVIAMRVIILLSNSVLLHTFCIFTSPSDSDVEV